MDDQIVSIASDFIRKIFQCKEKDEEVKTSLAIMRQSFKNIIKTEDGKVIKKEMKKNAVGACTPVGFLIMVKNFFREAGKYADTSLMGKFCMFVLLIAVLIATLLTLCFVLESVVALWVTGLIAALATLLVGVGVAEMIAAFFERKSLELPAIAAKHPVLLNMYAIF